MIFYGKKICCIGAHPDDIELGAGAFISSIVGKAEVLCVTLSDNKKNPALQNLVLEHHNSMKVLGVSSDSIRLGDFETRKFPQERQEILEYLYQLNKEYKPDIVLTHSKSDIHQDHNITTDEVLRAFRGVSVLGFDVIRSSYGFFPHFLSCVNQKDVDSKINALLEYETYRGKYYFEPELLRSILIRHGALAECRYAEGFDILRIIGSFEEPC